MAARNDFGWTAAILPNLRRIALGGAAILALSAPGGALAQVDEDEVYRQLDLFGFVFDRIRAEYIEPPDETELIRAAIQGMLSSLDPHSAYLTPESFADMHESTSGTFGGLGIEVTMEDDLVRVVVPYDDSPAIRGGILPNDFIVEIDGQQVMGMTLNDAVSLMRGPVGTDVDLVISREGAERLIEVTLTRDIIAVAAVRWSYERDVPIVRLSTFSAQAYSGLERAIREIMSAEEGPPSGIILDLRNNSGGLVDEAQRVADAFLDRGSIVLTRGRQPNQSARYDAQPDDVDSLVADVPLVVLINGGTASAAEIVAGALQDHGRATLVGTRSFGKGSVQTITRLGLDGGIRLTTARYYTPSNRSIQALGINPDIQIFQDVPEEFRGRDEIIGEAGLAGHIAGEDEEATVGSSVYVPADRDADNQMQYAIALILGTEAHTAFPPDPSAIVANRGRQQEAETEVEAEEPALP